MPTGISSTDEQAIFEELIDQFKTNRDELQLDIKENLARSLAKRSSIKKGKKLSQEEIDVLIDDLFACENSNYTPSGLPTFIILDLETINNYFTI